MKIQSIGIRFSNNIVKKAGLGGKVSNPISFTEPKLMSSAVSSAIVAAAMIKPIKKDEINLNSIKENLIKIFQYFYWNLYCMMKWMLQ